MSKDIPLSIDADIVLQVKSLGRVYARNRKATRKRLAGMALRALFSIRPKPVSELQPSEFWAVDSVSFDLTRGEALGVIGLNGSGKTTLLRLLAGQLVPDKGEIWVNGSSAAMIDLQAGFQSAASGRENVVLRAAALGFTRAQTREKFDAILEFSGLGDAIDAPIASYSAGMKMRLAFSIMANVSPDVLFIDEVLAVGDFQFRQKCLAKIREMRAKSAFVLVSHSMHDIERFCDRVIVMHKGKPYFEGAPAEAIEIYESLSADQPALETPQQLARSMGPIIENEEALANVKFQWCNMQGDPVTQVAFDQPFKLVLSFKCLIDTRSLIVGVPIWNSNSQFVTGLSTQVTSESYSLNAGESFDLTIEVDGGYLNPGVLKSMIAIMDGPEHIYRKLNKDLVISTAQHPTWGVVTVPHRCVRNQESEPRGRPQFAKGQS